LRLPNASSSGRPLPNVAMGFSRISSHAWTANATTRKSRPPPMPGDRFHGRSRNMIEKPLHIEPPRPPAIELHSVVVNYHFPRWRPLEIHHRRRARANRSSSLHPRLDSEMALDAATRLHGRLLDDLVGSVGTVCRCFCGRASVPWDQSSLAQRNGAAFTGGTLRRPTVLAAELGIQVSPTALEVCDSRDISCRGLRLRCHLLCSMGYLSSLPLWWIVRGIRSSLRQSIRGSIYFAFLFMSSCRVPSPL
jgi:hypothetical protein